MEIDKVRIIRVRHPDQLRPVLQPLTDIFLDFLKRSGEPFGVAEQWGAALRALAESDRTLFLLAVDDDLHPIGYVIAQTGYDFWGLKSVAVHQMQAEGPGIVRQFDDALVQWAKAEGAAFISGMSRRHIKAFARRMRMRPEAMLFIREVHTNGETAAAKPAGR